MSNTTAKTDSRPLRVLHVLSMLHNGGGEKWVVDLCQAGKLENISSDIAVAWQKNGLFFEIARERGIPVYHCEGGRNPWKFIRNLRKLLRDHGPYDTVHCHLHAFGSFAMLAARLEGVPVRILHSHNVVGNSSGPLRRRAYMAVTRALIRTYATGGIGPSSASTADLFGQDFRKDPRWRVLPYGIDLAPFRALIGAKSSRAALGIPPDAFLLGSVGRLDPEKNSEFLVDVLAAVLKLRADAYLLLIGEGPLREKLERKAREGGYSDRLILPGVRADVAALLRSVIDVFVFPSPSPPRGNEALPLAVTEAQAAGLPCVLSDGIPPESILVPNLILQIKADAGPDKWAEAVILQTRPRDSEVARRALELIEKTPHNCAVNIKTLAALYRGEQAT
jgi:glycosyltransferase involved in cell wall biosynthesis